MKQRTTIEYNGENFNVILPKGVEPVKQCSRPGLIRTIEHFFGIGNHWRNPKPNCPICKREGQA